MPGLAWSDTVLVADAGVYGKTMPRIALNSAGEPIIVWGLNSNNSKMHVATWNGIRFNEPVDILPLGLNPRVTFTSSPDIAAIGDEVFITYATLPEGVGSIYLQKSTDGGSTFTDTIRVDTYPDSTTTYSSSIDLKSDGNPAIVFFKKNGLNEASFADVSVTSSDGGFTYSPPQNCTQNGPGVPTDCCQPSITVRNNYHAVLYRNDYLGFKEIYAALSSDHGASFDTVIRFDRSDFSLAVCPISNPIGTLQGDTLFGMWMTMATGTPRVVLGALDVVNGSFAFNKDIDNTVPSSVSQGYPSITGRGDTLGFVWADDRNASSSNDCIFRYSFSGSGQLSPPINIHGGPMVGNQITPDVIFRNGVFHFVWADFSHNIVVYRSATIDTSIVAGGREEVIAEFNISPNPFSEVINIAAPNDEITDLNIWNSAGQLVAAEVANNGKLRLSTETWPKGVYLIEVTSSAQIYRQKVVKQ